MSYRKFTLEKVKKDFNLQTIERLDVFADTPEVESSSLLGEILRYNLPVAIASNSEKARSEMLTAPILVEFKKQNQEQISLFSGVDFNVDESRGLSGTCDFLISQSWEQLIITAPVAILVEAKKENLNKGLGQCIAEMVAAQVFNQQHDNNIPIIYGAITSGTNWRFLKLEGTTIIIDLSEYYLRDINKILGILSQALSLENKLD